MFTKLFVSMKNFIFLLLTFCLLCSSAYGQKKGTVSGTITEDGYPLIGVSVFVEGTTMGAITGLDGMYSLNLPAGTYDLTASYVGYDSQTQSVEVTAGGNTTLDFSLASGIMVDEIIVTGTRATNRTNLESAVPVDVLNVKKLTVAAPQTNLNQLLHATTPSFSSNTQTISDGTDHIDPASLRGLGPDQVLVLINGKRRHTTSLVNTNGTFGRGNVGTDLNAIPAFAIDKIEVLRDGAAAQYGSDAIGGVINIKLREDINKLNVNVTTGANFTSNIGPFEGETKDYDGEVVNVSANYGLPLGESGGIISLTGEMDYRGATSRMQEFSGDIFNGMNAIERLAAADGLDVTQLSLDQVKSYGSQVSYFSPETQSAINGMQSVGEFGDVLGFDVTTSELAARGQTRSDYNMRVGQSAVRGGKLFANLSYPVGEFGEVYAFGGASYRNGESGCFYRLPSQNRTTTSIYPNGTVPKINSNITDRSLGAGIRGMVGNWNSDFSVVSGSNKFLFHMTDTHNATLGTSSPTTFDAGGHSFGQTTGNIDFSQYVDLGALPGVNIAFGGEYRYENFKVIPGSEASFGNYDVNGNLVTPVTPDELQSTDLLGRSRPSGSQCFAGFLHSNEVDANRSSVGAYIDAEFDITEALLIGGAVRFENYSDFGSTFNYKATGRFKITDNLVARAAFSTGFRAPSLHQIHYSRTSTIFTVNDAGVSVPEEVGIFANTSRAAKLLGIPELKEETSQNISVGLTAKIPNAGLKLTVDAYQVTIDDRVILTGQFGPENDELSRIFRQAGATRAAFFANSIDTKSQGIDVVVSHSISFAEGKVLRNDLAGTFTRTEWDQDAGINSSDVLRNAGLEGTYFDQTSRIYLEQAVPRVKVTLGNSLTLGKFNIYLRNTYFGETTEATNSPIFTDDLELRNRTQLEDYFKVELTDPETGVMPTAAEIDDAIAGLPTDPYYSPKIVTDLSIGYNFTNNFSLVIGANNLLDVYPDEANPAFQSSGRFVYSRRSPQFSFSGRHVFARVSLTL